MASFSLGNILKKIEQIMDADSLNVRNNVVDTLFGMTTLSRYWNQKYHWTGQEVPANAFMFGLVINDWDRSLRSRNVNISTFDLLIPFQHINKIPDWKKSAEYQDVNEIMGRFEPIPVYARSGPQQFQIELIYQAEARTDLELKTFWSLERIEKIDKKLKSLVYPLYNQGFGAPPKCLLNIGNLYRQMPVIVKDVQVSHEPPYDVFTGLPITRKITLELQSSYPMWQAISGDQVFTATYGNGIFAYQKLSSDYQTVSRRRKRL